MQWVILGRSIFSGIHPKKVLLHGILVITIVTSVLGRSIGFVCQVTLHNNTVHVLFFFIFFIFFTTNQHQNILTFFTFYITSIIFYYYPNKKIHYNTKFFHFFIQILFTLYHIITFY
jgi:hypothetical protein